MEISFIDAALRNTGISIQPSLDYSRTDDPICRLPNPFLPFLIAIVQGFSNLSNAFREKKIPKRPEYFLNYSY